MRVSGHGTGYVRDLAATLPVAVSGSEAVYLYGLDCKPPRQAC